MNEFCGRPEKTQIPFGNDNQEELRNTTIEDKNATAPEPRQRDAPKVIAGHKPAAHAATTEITHVPLQPL
jgi:hypothetical protein